MKVVLATSPEVPPVADTVFTPPDVIATVSEVVLEMHSPGAVALVEPAVQELGLAVNALVKEYDTPSLAANPSAMTAKLLNILSGKPDERTRLSVGQSWDVALALSPHVADPGVPILRTCTRGFSVYVVVAELVPSVTERVCAPAASVLTLTSLIPRIEGSVFGVRWRASMKLPSASVMTQGDDDVHAVF